MELKRQVMEVGGGDALDTPAHQDRLVLLGVETTSQRDDQVPEHTSVIYGEKIGGVYDVLVEECGAPEALREEFVHYISTPVKHGHEFRFQGELGFGGKIHVTRHMIWVSCYPEDRTAARVDAMASAVRRIGRLVFP